MKTVFAVTAMFLLVGCATQEGTVGMDHYALDQTPEVEVCEAEFWECMEENDFDDCSDLMDECVGDSMEADTEEECVRDCVCECECPDIDMEGPQTRERDRCRCRCRCRARIRGACTGDAVDNGTHTETETESETETETETESEDGNTGD